MIHPHRPTSRLRALLLRILHQRSELTAQYHDPIPELTLRAVLYICYKVDCQVYRELGTSLTHTTYRALPEGPVPDGFYRVLTRLVRQHRIRLIPPVPRPPVTHRDLDRTILLPAHTLRRKPGANTALSSHYLAYVARHTTPSTDRVEQTPELPQICAIDQTVQLQSNT